MEVIANFIYKYFCSYKIKYLIIVKCPEDNIELFMKFIFSGSHDFFLV